MRFPRVLFPILLLWFSMPVRAHHPRDLVGVWIIQPPSPPGVVVLQTVTFSQNKGSLTGSYKSFGRSEEPDTAPIKDVKVSDDRLSFKVVDRWGVQLWEGSFADTNRLEMKWFFVEEKGQLEPLSTRVFQRSSTAEVVALTSKLPTSLIFHKLPLPELRDLPSNGLARTPPMGWSTWNRFMESIDDTEVRETADALVSSGLRDAGYTLVEVDDGWQGKRDKQGVLHSNSKFPDMKVLADYVHSKGLKFGIYTDVGSVSCAGYTGSHGYEAQDAQTFAQWGVDFVMNDICGGGEIYKTRPEMRALHQKMAEALRATGRPIVYKVHDALNAYEISAFEDGRNVESWGRKVGANLWRTGGDLVIGDRWKSVSKRFEQHGNPDEAGPGGWNDEDNLVIGLPGVMPGDRALTIDESRTHMTLWAILASPLILGNDVRAMTREVKDILLNREVIAVDQDRLGRQGRCVSHGGDVEIWTKPLSDGSLAVALFNRGNAATSVAMSWKVLGLEGALRVRDLWRHADLGEQLSGYAASVPAHGSVLFRLQAAHERS
jgi:alpha-galactosidase